MIQNTSNLFGDLYGMRTVSNYSSPQIDAVKSVLATPVMEGGDYGAYDYSSPQAAVSSLYSASTTPTGSPDWNAYLAANPDVMNGYNHLSSGDRKRFPTAASYAQYHYSAYGQSEGRALPTIGGSTTQPSTTPVTTPATTTPTSTPPIVTSGGGAVTLPPPPSPTDYLRDTPGYQFQVQEGLKGILANAYAKGIGNSGATMKALEEFARNQADGTYQQAVANNMAVAQLGSAAAGALAGAGNSMQSGVTNATNNAAQAYQNQANAATNAANQRANATTSMATGIANGLGMIGGSIGGNLFGSSYGR